MPEIPTDGDKLNLADTLGEYEAGFIDGVLDARGIEKPTTDDFTAAYRSLLRIRERAAIARGGRKFGLR